MSIKKTGGLAGIVAGETAISAAGGAHNLEYRGYSIYDLAEHCIFEEVAYLLLYGALPAQDQLDTFMERLHAQRDLPKALKGVLEQIPADTHPMDVMRTGVSLLGNLEHESESHDQYAISERLLATLPAILAYWWNYAQNAKRIECTSDAQTIAGHFLTLLHQKPDVRLHVRAMHVSLILYAEHEFNASTFTARIIASTLSDFYSAVGGAIGALRGPLHGGANEAAMEIISRAKNPDDAAQMIRQMLENKDLIMGFGHRVYSEADPRNRVIKDWSKRLCTENGQPMLYEISETIEKLMWEEKNLFPNLDFYSASVYHMMDIPTPLFTPIFVMSRVSGWAAHIFEQRSNNKLIRPNADYTGANGLKFINIEDR